MLKKIIFITLLVLLTHPTSVKAETTVKVLNFNIGTFDNNSSNLTPEQRRARMYKLAEFIKSEQVEVAMFQEFSNRHLDLQQLTQALNEKNYSMYVDYVSYEEHTEEAAILLILSKYPFDKSSKKYTFTIRDNRSAQSIRIVNSPIGWFRVSNIHTHYSEPCLGFSRYLNFYYQYDKTNNLLGGDINLSLFDQVGSSAAQAQAICEGINWEDVNIGCTTSTCVGWGPSWNTPYIEWFVLPAQTDLYLNSHYKIPNGDVRLQLSDGHAAYLAQVGSVNPKFNPTPTPTPVSSPTPTPTNVPTPTPGYSKFDVNRDSKVTVLDAIVVMDYIFR